VNRSILLSLLALPLAGCGAAQAAVYNSADPVQCAAIFSVTGHAAKLKPDGALADEMFARLIHLAKSNGGSAWVERTTPEALKHAAAWEAASDRTAILKLFEECRARQDSDPAFQEATPALIAEAMRMRQDMR
jgi:hypothetical protein